MNKPLGDIVPNNSLSETERNLVTAAWDASSRAWDHFPVGSAILAVNRLGESKVFLGCNVANDAFPAILCAEHNAVTTAVQEGFTEFTHVAVVCRNQPGGFPCGLCRQVLKQYAHQNATFLGILDKDSNVCRMAVADLLPPPSGQKLPYNELSSTDKLIVDQALSALTKTYVPYSKLGRAAVAVAAGQTDKHANFLGVQIDNASYPVSISAETSAISAAIAAGCTRIEKLALAVSDSDQPPLIDGKSLQFLREFGGVTAEVLFIGADRSVLFTNVGALLPGSFGPESLGTVNEP